MTGDEEAVVHLGVIADMVSGAADALHLFLMRVSSYGHPNIPGPGKLVDAKLELERIAGELEDLAKEIRPAGAT